MARRHHSSERSSTSSHYYRREETRRESPVPHKKRKKYSPSDEGYDRLSDCRVSSHHNSSEASSHEHTHHKAHKHHHDEKDSYKHKRPRHYSSSPSSSPEEVPYWDDEERHYKIHLGECLTPRYKILSEMGEGTFGRVVECWDREKKRNVAVKIVRAIEKYRDAARLEIEVLDTLQKYDPGCTQGHVCMVFEKHGLSLYDFMEKNSFRAFSKAHVREIAYQLIHSISFLHSLTLIHTDLKPENILFVDSAYDYVTPSPSATSDFSPLPLRVPVDPSIKLIDFGSATFNHRYHTTVVSTRHYRAPEVILGMGWSYPCDMWSIGCILLQLYTGDALFQTHENREHLAMMEKVLGRFPDYFIAKADRHSRKYFRKGRVVFPENDATSSEKAKQTAHLKYVFRLEEYISPKDDLILDLLGALLEYDPRKRITARDALRHPYFDGVRDLYRYSSPKGSYR